MSPVNFFHFARSLIRVLDYVNRIINYAVDP